MIHKLIQQLFDGDYRFSEKAPIRTENYIEANKRIEKYEAILKSKFASNEDKVCLQDFKDSLMDYCSERELQAYQGGIQFAIQFLITGLDKD